VIDCKEAQRLFEPDVGRVNTEEYSFSNDVFGGLDLAAYVAEKRFKKQLAFTGALADGA